MGRFAQQFREAFTGGLLTRFSAVFAATILVPSLLVLSYNLISTTRQTREQVISNAENIVDDVFSSVSGAFETGFQLAGEIAFDTTLRNFLNDDFPDSGRAVADFLSSVRPIVDHALRFGGRGIDGARIVTRNPTHPESWPYFVGEERMRGLHWFTEFVDGPLNHIWVIPNVGGVYSKFELTQVIRNDVYTVVRKIDDFSGRYIGSVIVDVLQDHVHAAMHDLTMPTIDFAIASADGGFWHEASVRTVDAIERLDWQKEIGSAQPLSDGIVPSGGQFTYVHRTIADAGVTVSARIHLREQLLASARSRISIAGVIILGVVGLEIGTFLILNQVFRRLSAMTATMDRVAGGEFDIRIPIEHDDEIGQIGRDFNVLIGKIDDLVRDSVRKETLQKDTELKALQFQINPHFIYNTIDAFRMQLELADQDELADSMADFGKLIRYNTAAGSLFVPLDEELDVIDQYVRLQKLRSGQISLSTQDARGVDAKILRFVLQPIVENSIRHGLDFERPLSIGISAHRMNGHLRVSVADDGIGMEGTRLEELRSHLQASSGSFPVDGENAIGLANIGARLSLFYGERATFEVDSEPMHGTVVSLQVPVERDADPDR